MYTKSNLVVKCEIQVVTKRKCEKRKYDIVRVFVEYLEDVARFEGDAGLGTRNDVVAEGIVVELGPHVDLHRRSKTHESGRKHVSTRIGKTLKNHVVIFGRDSQQIETNSIEN